MDATDYLSFLREAAEYMYERIWSARERYTNTSLKELGKILDLESARALKELLRRERYKFRVIAEEGFGGPHEDEYPILLVDPIDGTNNFVRGIPHSSISLAISSNDEEGGIFVGVIKDLFTKDLYVGVRNEGAFLNNRRISPSNVEDISKAFISINFNKIVSCRSPIVSIFKYVSFGRFFGSTALEICNVACGKLDAFIDIRSKLRVFDVAAAYIVAKEAGAKVILFQNGERHVKLSKVGGISVIAASTDRLLRRIAELIKVKY